MANSSNFEIAVGQTSVAKYMARHRGPPSQNWKTFLRNHADGIASIDLFVVPTLSFRLLYGLLILNHSRRQILWLGVTTHPTAEWMAQQLIEACGWEWTPKYIVRDRDSVYGEVFTRRLRTSAFVTAHRATIAVAESTYGTIDSLDSAGLSRPYRRLQRAASASPPPFL